MPANAVGVIAVVVDVIAKASYAFSRQDLLAACSQIPAGGTVLQLPSGAQSGDLYEFADVDGSCSPGSRITLLAAAGQTIQGGASVNFGLPFSWGIATFDEDLRAWVLKDASTAGTVPGPLGPNPFFNVPDWFIAPVTGDDANDGLTALTPVQHYREVARRWNTTSPVITNALGTNLHFLESFPDLNDPVVWTPIDPHGFGARILCPLTVISSGVLAGVVPKSPAAGHGLEVDLGVAAAGAISNWLINTTRAGASFVRAVVAGTVVAVNQPLDLATDSLEVDTYANGDFFQVATLTQVNLAAINSAVTLQHVFLPSTLVAPVILGGTERDCRIEASVTAKGDLLANCLCVGNSFDAASVNGGSLSNVGLSGDCFLALDCTMVGSDLFGDATLPSSMDDTQIVGTLRLAGAVSQVNGSTFYGTNYTVNVTGQGSLFAYSGSANTAVSAFQGTLTALLLEAQGLAATISTAPPLAPTFITGIALTPANLDANIVGGGFAHLAIDNALTTWCRIFSGTSARPL